MSAKRISDLPNFFQLYVQSLRYLL